MTVRAGFAEVDITPPVGTHKIGWLRDIVSDTVLDPICARLAVIESGAERIAFVQLDTLSIRWTQVNDIRRRINEAYGFPGERVLVAATHNHAGPAVANTGEVKRDEAYIETLVQRVVEGFGKALDRAEEAEIGFGRCFEFAVPHNRRVIMRDGTCKTQATFKNPDALYIEGPVDPEVAVLFARRPGGDLLGAVVNFACHPTHHGGTGELSGGFPGCLAREMQNHGCPVTLFLNGASGNIIDVDQRTGQRMTKEEIGRRLAADVRRALGTAAFTTEARLGASSRTIRLPYRNPTDDEIHGRVRGAQRFIDPEIYERHNLAVAERIRRRGTQPAEVQVLFVNDVAYAGIPAEYFVEHQLRIKLESWPRRALVVGHANGMVGYVPTRAAFERGGYETTFAGSSRMAPEAGDLLADAAIEQIRAGAG